jgi:8-oxo-dGTP pyrophosphatase MutT (NUDIX family)
MEKIRKSSLLIIKDKKVLFTKEFGKDRYFTPGGKIEDGETEEDALVREVKEELGSGLDRASIKFVAEFEDMATLEKDTVLNLKFYTGKIIEEMKPSTDIEELKWFGRNDDWSKLGNIDKNKVMPWLVKGGLI